MVATDRVALEKTARILRDPAFTAAL